MKREKWKRLSYVTSAPNLRQWPCWSGLNSVPKLTHYRDHGKKVCARLPRALCHSMKLHTDWEVGLLSNGLLGSPHYFAEESASQ